MTSPTDIAPPLALTMGEPGGVGPELTAAAWEQLRSSAVTFFVIADPQMIKNTGVAVTEISAPSEAPTAFSAALPVLPIENSINATPGVAAPENAAAVIESIRRATSFALDGAASGVVTSPIQKSSLIDAGFEFLGHTEFLADLTKHAPVAKGDKRGAVMMIAGPNLKSVPVTIHKSVINAVKSLTTGLIVETGLVTAQALISDFGIKTPRLALSGLNPHAGEGGALGKEDNDIIAPAVKALRRSGIDACGPLPADTMFHAEARTTYDAALCMLHDQALIPAKTLGFHDAVNVTLGLPVIRTSPDHGTALDIAGKGVARADSLIAAIKLAAALSARRRGQTS